MKYLKSFENKTLDRILDKISSVGFNSLSNDEKDFLDKHSKNQDTDEIEKDLNTETYEDNIGPFEAKIKFLDKDSEHWNAKLYVNDIEYDGYIVYQDFYYISCIFDSDDSDIFTDLEGLEHEIDSFCSGAFYDKVIE